MGAMRCKKKELQLNLSQAAGQNDRVKMILEDRWLPNEGQIAIKVTVWDHRVVPFEGRWLFNRGGHQGSHWAST